MCFWCSKEPSHWDGSFELPREQHIFELWNKKKFITPSDLEVQELFQKTEYLYLKTFTLWVVKVFFFSTTPNIFNLVQWKYNTCASTCEKIRFFQLLNSIFLIKSKYPLYIFANSADPDEMLQNAAFHPGFHCLPRYIFAHVSRMKRIKRQNYIVIW